MNIFILSADPIEAAMMQCDKHVVKMVLESAQILSTVMSYYGDETAPYKPTHVNHPCVVWARESKRNYMWLFRHFKALLDEYTYRYKKIHACERLIELFVNFKAFNNTESPSEYEFCQCVPDEFKCNDPVKAYQNYYKSKPDWVRKYTNRQLPAFMGA